MSNKKGKFNGVGPNIMFSFKTKTCNFAGATPYPTSTSSRKDINVLQFVKW